MSLTIKFWASCPECGPDVLLSVEVAVCKNLPGFSRRECQIFNYRLIVFGLLILLFSIYTIIISSNRVETVSGSFMVIASFYFMLIGVFLYDFNPPLIHAFCSNLILFDRVSVCHCLGGWLTFGRKEKLGLIILLFSISTPIVVGFLSYYSAALVESYGILVLGVWICSITFVY